MQARRILPLFCTSKIAESKAFYTSKLGFRVTFDNEHFVSLRIGDEGPEIAFMDDKEGPHASGQGLYYCFEVGDVDQEHRELVHRNVAIAHPPEDQPWGDRRMMCVDPSGIMLYLYQRIQPSVAMQKD
jgi:predicted enzyme related to lactoylglutathione lyase